MPSMPREPMHSPEHPAMRHNRPNNQREDRPKGWMAVFVVLVVLLIAGGACLFFLKTSVIKNMYSYTKKEDASVWQAVFLANGQVYFGHLKERTSKYPVLTNIYYLQVNQNLQAANQNTNTNTNTNEPQVSLIKLGDELHGPKDEMYIAKDQILFWEDLKEDSQVVTAIKNYKK